MKLTDLVARTIPPTPWSEGALPWGDPDFSARMLREHLTQDHDRASRRNERIDAHVEWLHTEVLRAKPGRVLDLACGPGLYIERLSARGHECVGVDVSPASIDHARSHAGAGRYVLGDILTADYGDGYDLCTFVFGQLNSFPRTEAEEILRRAHAALASGGALVVEASTVDHVKAMARPSRWYTARGGLFSDAPHLVLHEGFWSDEHGAATERYYVVDPATHDVTPYALSSQAYTEDEYRALFAACGFSNLEIHPGLGEAGDGLIALVGRR